MSSRNGDKSRFNRLRKAKLRMRELTRTLTSAKETNQVKVSEKSTKEA